MKKKILFVLCLLFGLMFINAGLNKFFNYMPMPEEIPEDLMQIMGAFMQIKWLMPLVAVAEIAGGLLIIIPKVRALGAIVIFPVMVGIVIHNIIYMFDVAGLIIALVMLGINLWAIIGNKDKYLPMIC